MNYKKLLVYAPDKHTFEVNLANDIIDQDAIVFIEEPKEIWVLGIFYPCPYSKVELDKIIEDINNEITKDEEALDEFIKRINGNVSDDYNSLEKIENKIKEEVTNRIDAISDLTNRHNQDILDLSNTISSNKSETDLKIANLTTKHDSELESLTNKHNQDVVNINNSIATNRSELDLTISDLTNKHNEEISTLTTKHDNDVTNINSKIDNNKAGTDKLISDLEDKHDTDVSSLTNTILLNKEDTDQQIQDLTFKHNLDVNTINSKIDDNKLNADKQISDLEDKHDLDITSLNTLISNNKTEADLKITDLTNSHNLDVSDINQAISDLSDRHDSEMLDITNKLGSTTIVKVAASNSTIASSYELHDKDGNKKGVTIDIPKDQSIKDIKVSTLDATLNNDGEIVDGTGTTALCISYILSDGTYKIARLDYLKFLEETEFGNGTEVVDHVIHVKIDSESESFLTVSPDGVKLSGVQNAINTAKTNVENLLASNVNTINNYTVNGLKISENPVITGSNTKATGYIKPTSTSAIEDTDTVNNALGKLEKGLEEEISNRETDITNLTNIVNANKLDIDNYTINNIKVSTNPVITGANSKVTGYSKPADTSAISTTDSINSALGKLEKGLENEISDRTLAINTLTGTLNNDKTTIDNYTVNDIKISLNPVIKGSNTKVTDYTKPETTSSIVATDTVNIALGKLEKGLENEIVNRNTEDSNLTTLINNNKTAIDNYTINGIKVSSNPVINGSNASMTGYTKPTSTGEITITDSINSAIGKLEKKADDHIADENNPHNVTLAQVGLSNVDNTSDIDKPVSTALKAELDKKVDKVNNKSLVDNTLITKLSGLKDLTDITADINSVDNKVSNYTVNGIKISTNPVVTGLNTKVSSYTKPTTTSSITANDTVNQAIGKLEKGLENEISDRNTAISNLSNALGTDKNTIDNYTVNSIKISTNPVITGSNTKITGYTKATTTESISATDSVNAAIGKLEKKVDDNISSISIINGTEEGSITKAKNDAASDATSKANTALANAKTYTDTKIQSLNVSDSAVTDLFITSVSETGGKISISRARPTASNISISDDNFTSSDVKGALNELYNLAGSGSKVTITESAGTGSVLKKYVIKQGNIEVGTINIAKDLVVTSGEVITATTESGLVAGDKYIKLTIANQATPIYIAVKSLIDIYTSGNGVNVADNNQISAVIDTASEVFLTVSANGIKLSGVLVAINTAKDSAITTSGNLTVNSKKINTNPILSGADIKATGYTKATTVSAVDATDTLNSAIGKLENKADTHIANKANPHSVTKALVGLGNVDNTSDINKPVSTATQTALNTKVDKVNNKSLVDNDLIAKLSDLKDQTEISKDIADLDEKVSGYTINGKAISTNPSLTKSDVGLGNVNNTSDANKPISTATQTALNNKVDKITGKGLSTNDYTTTEKNKLAGIADGALVNTVTGVKGSAESTYRTGNINITAANIGLGNVNNTSDANKPISTATQTALNSKVDKVTGKSLVSDSEITKLSDLPTNETLTTNIADAKKAGTDALSSITAHAAKKDNPHAVTKAQVGLSNVTNDALVKRSEMGAASGVATLGSDGKVPSSLLPSYVDDVLEYTAKTSFPTTGETGKIYVDTATNKTYRWSGTAYIEISPSLALGETSSTAYAGDKGKATTDKVNSHIANTSNPHSVTKAQVGLGNVDNTSDASKPVSTALATAIADAKKVGTDALTSLNSHTANKSNPHGVTKSLVGLSNVGNFKAVSTVASLGLTDTEKTNARANIGAGTSSFSGSYSDLTNKPTIPTVNNATLTILKNGTNVTTFTANASTNVTANILVPTKVSELSNDSGFTSNTGTVTLVKVGTVAYNPTSGIISLPAYPTVPSAIKNPTSITIQKNGTSIGSYDGSEAKTINISDVASASTLSSHTGNTTVHITAAERTKWNKVVTDLASILGTDTDTVINKWEEIVAFLDTYTEADTLAGLLGNKVDKVSGKGLSTNDFTSVLLTKLNGIADGANKYTLPTASSSTLGGVKIGSNISITDGVISTHAPYSLPTASTNALGGIKTGYTSTGKNYKVQTDTNGNAFVNVPWTDSGYTLTKDKVEAVLTGNITTHTHNLYLTSHLGVTNKAATLAWNTASTVATVGSTDITVKLPANPNTDTKNTAGSTDTSSKIFLIGATSQAANPQTYSHDTAYVGTDGCLYSGGAKVLTAHQSLTNYCTKTEADDKYQPKGSYAAASHTHTFASLTSKPTTLSGYGITDAKIANGVITLGGNTITPITSHLSLTKYVTIDTTLTISGSKMFTVPILLHNKDTKSANGILGIVDSSTSWRIFGEPAGLPYPKGLSLYVSKGGEITASKAIDSTPAKEVTAYILDTDGNTSFPEVVTAKKFKTTNGKYNEFLLANGTTTTYPAAFFDNDQDIPGVSMNYEDFQTSVTNTNTNIKVKFWLYTDFFDFKNYLWDKTTPTGEFTIPDATSTNAGLISASTLTIGGLKTFNNNVIFNGAINANTISPKNDNTSEQTIGNYYKGDNLTIYLQNKVSGYNSNWTVTQSGDAVFNSVYSRTSSDIRNKENIEDFNALKLIHSLGGIYQFDYKDTNKHSYGLIALNVKESELSDIVGENKDKTFNINYLDPRLISISLKGVEEVNSKTEALENKVVSLEKEVEELKAIIKDLIKK